MPLEIGNGEAVDEGVLNALKAVKPFERVMIFVDGGYLRELCKGLYKNDNINFGKLSWTFIRMFNTYSTNPFQANSIRIYYYDAIADKSHPDYETQRKYFESIDDQYAYTVRLGQLVQSSKKLLKQKGVDILMAIDAITKAYTNQYDTAMFMMGDRDFIPLIEAVKDAGKKTMCVYYPRNSSKDLIRTFDMRISFDEKAIQSWLTK
jgi:uncharacterized LabA/DUF88 family protein